MGAALYFIEGVNAVSPELIAELGLAYALAPGCAHRLAASGPGDSGGAVCSLVGDQLGYYPDAQVWHALGERAGKRIWFGFLADSPPGPADLASPQAIAGDLVKLFDGREWLIPRAIARTETGWRLTAPAATKRTAAGWERGAVKAAYRRLDEIARLFWDRFHGTVEEPEERLLVANCLDWSVEILSVNYRLSADEVGCLGLLDDQAETAVEVLKAVIDYRTFLEFSQKKSK